MRGLVLVGASGLAREATTVAAMRRPRDPIQVVDDDPTLWGTLHGPAPVLGPVEEAAGLQDQDVVLTLGQGRTRRLVAMRLEMLGMPSGRYTSLVHPGTVLPGSCTIGTGCVVLDGVVCTADVVLGDHVVLMPHVTLTHGCVVEDFATICAGVSLGGDVRVGPAAYLGMNSSVRQGVSVGEGATLGMGSVLLHDLPPGETWIGVPARPLPIGVPA